jgi:hypothetical protein
VVLASFALAATLGAETKISGTQQCKAEQPSPVAIGDKPNHAFAIVKAECTWPKPIEMAGGQTKAGTDVIAMEMNGNTATDHGYYVGVMDNGDKFFVNFGGTSTSKDGKPVGSKGTWSFTGGEGKLKGLKGKGTYKGTPNADGTVTNQIDGEYSLP